MKKFIVTASTILCLGVLTYELAALQNTTLAHAATTTAHVICDNANR